MQPLLPRAREEVLHTPIFTMLRQPTPIPGLDRELDFYVMRAPDWVNVLPITSEGQLVCVRQYRVGSEDFSLEIPGGMVDPGDADPQAGVARELLEETGYSSSDWRFLGSCDPNPAIQTNALHTYLALDCRKVAPPQTDSSEQIELQLFPVEDIDDHVARGQISHALVLVAFHWYRLWQQGRIPADGVPLRRRP